MRLIKSMRLTASVRLIERTWALRAGPSTACVTNVKDRYGECNSRASRLQDNLAAQTWPSSTLIPRELADSFCHDHEL